MDFETNLKTDTVEKAQASDPIVVEPSATVREAFQLLKMHKTGSLLVSEGEKLVGIFTERDALKLMASGADLDGPISDRMTSNPTTICPETTVAEAIQQMVTGGYRRLPTVDAEGRLVGIVKVSGIIDYMVDHFPETVFNLPPKSNVVMEQREGA